MMCAHLPLALALARRRPLESLVARLLTADVVVLLISMLWANIDEPRAFMPHFALITFAVTLSIANRGGT